MRWLVVVFLGLLALAAPGQAVRAADQTPSSLPSSDRDAIRGVIQEQLGAFKMDDANAAYGLASPNIQQMFGDAGHFLAMVKQGYPPVYRPRSVAFGTLIDVDGQTIQKVELVGPDGKSALALYTMEREADGNWRIDGCMLTESEDVGA